MHRIHLAAGALCMLMSASALAELKVYDVDFKYRDEVFGALREVLHHTQGPHADGEAFGRVEKLPTGQILVETTPEAHAQIETVLAAIAARQTAPAPRVTLRYWVVLGSPGGQDASGLPPVLSGTLDELRRAHGPMGFRVLDSASLVTETGQRGELDGQELDIGQEADVHDGSLSAALEIDFEDEGLELNATIDAGEFLVLGESSYEGDDVVGQLFYIVHWPNGE